MDMTERTGSFSMFCGSTKIRINIYINLKYKQKIMFIIVVDRGANLTC